MYFRARRTDWTVFTFVMHSLSTRVGIPARHALLYTWTVEVQTCLSKVRIGISHDSHVFLNEICQKELLGKNNFLFTFVLCNIFSTIR